MTARTISTREMRDRLLAQAEAAKREDWDWQKAIHIPGNRQLLALLASQRPRSVTELAESAGRAQPNVSRSLAQLVKSGLVELRHGGRTSTPLLTDLGREKVAALEIAPAEPTHQPAGEETARHLLSVQVDENGGETLVGTLTARLPLRDRNEPVPASRRGDLAVLADRWLGDWWRIMHRTDSEYRLCDLRLKLGGGRNVTLLAKSYGQRIKVTARAADDLEGAALDRDAASFHTDAFERMILDGVILPLVASLKGCDVHDHRLHGLLARLEESRSNPADAEFCRTAGALGVSPYDLDQAASSRVRDLILMLPKEDVRLDFASALLADELEIGQEWVSSELSRVDGRNALTGLRDQLDACSAVRSRVAGLRPKYRGIELAKQLRTSLDLAPDRSVEGLGGLARLLGAPDFQPSGEAPGYLLAYQERRQNDATVIVGAREEAPAVFLLGRALGDYLAFGDDRACIADIYTDRQALGRAFAAELIAPASAVVAMVEDEGLSENRVARHFGASLAVIRHQRENNSNGHARPNRRRPTEAT